MEYVLTNIKNTRRIKYSSGVFLQIPSIILQVT